VAVGLVHLTSQLEDVDRALVTRAREHGGCGVETAKHATRATVTITSSSATPQIGSPNAVNLSAIDTSTQLLQQIAGARVVHTNEGALCTGPSQPAQHNDDTPET
jgi:hypothetical protein